MSLSMTVRIGYSFDAPRFLGFTKKREDYLPAPEFEEVVLHYGGWNFQELSAIAHELECDGSVASAMAVSAGIYRLRIPIPDSEYFRPFERQKHVGLLTGEDVAPAILVATAALCIKRAAILPLSSRHCWIRCEERHENARIAMRWRGDGKLHVSQIGDDAMEFVHLAGCRKI